MKKLAIVGSRDYPDLAEVAAFVAALPEDTHIISGGAPGVDSVAEEAARRRGWVVQVIRPDYDRYLPKVAPLMRNTEIVAAADEVVAFWDGASRGTEDALKKAREMGKPVRIVYPHIYLLGTTSKGEPGFYDTRLPYEAAWAVRVWGYRVVDREEFMTAAAAQRMAALAEEKGTAATGGATKKRRAA